MSTWNIYHKDGSKLTDVNGEQITVHGLEYSDSWMGECFLTISFKHEVPINFQIGDYIVYRGERFELNYEPGKDKQARPDTYGEGFVYDSVKFNALQDELSRAEFLDVVLNDNELHYTALPKFPFYVQTLDDLLDRIQANLDEQIGKGLWKIYSRNMERSVQRGGQKSEWMSMYGEGTSDNVIESMSITVDSQTCWQALALVNEKWNINFIVRGRNVYVGTTGIQANHIFKYGLGNGLYEIVQNADSDQSVVTRLRAYGSEKNLPSHYYADLGVKYVANITKVVTASTNVELELDVDYIETYFNNKRKYVVSGESQEQSFGWVLQVTFDFQTTITGYVTQYGSSGKCRFYSELKGTQTDTGDEESKEKLDAFISQVKAGNTKMYITSGLNKKNVPSSMKEYAENLPNNMSINRLMLPGFPHVSLSDFYDSLTDEEKKYVNPTGKQHRLSTDPYRPYIDSLNIDEIGLRSASQFFDTDDKTNGVIEIYPTIEEMEIGGVRVDEIDEGVAPDDDGRFGDNETVKNVDIYLKNSIDFDINDLKDDDFSISMKDGMCGGRTFKVASSTKVDGRWRLTIERIKDDALELWFPYKDYPIRKGDHFVLTGITLPDSYVKAASLKLLKYAIAYLDKNDYTRYVYQPKVDELFMARQHDKAVADTTGTIKSLHDTLKAGDLMEFEDTDIGIGGIISIDQLTIKEEDGKIPTYDITLRDDKEVGTIQKIQDKISSLQNGVNASLTESQVKTQVAVEGSKYFVSKLTDDTAKGTITWEKVQKFMQGMDIGDNAGQWTREGVLAVFKFLTNNFEQGLYGHGAQIDEYGNMEANSIFARQFISAPKFVFNEISVTKAEQWNTNGYGTIKSVDVTNHTITLKLEENDYGSLSEGDICRGIYADIENTYGSDTNNEGEMDDCGFTIHRGFFTTYFYVKKIITAEKGKFVFEYGKRSEGTPDPCAFMDFAQYGNFTDEQRQSSMYFCSRGRSYIEVLDGVNTWEIQAENRVTRYGWLGGLRVKKTDGTWENLRGNGLFAQNNVYLGGAVITLSQIKDLDSLKLDVAAYDVTMSQPAAVITVDDLGNVINGLWSVDEAGVKQYRISTAIFAHKGENLLLLEDEKNMECTAGHYRVYAIGNGCDVKVENGVVFLIGINKIKDGVAGSSDDAYFDYDAMRKISACSITIVVELEGKVTKNLEFPVRIHHDSLPFMVCDLSNENASIAWNTKTAKYIGLPITTKVSLMYQNTPWEISDLSVGAVNGLKASISLQGKEKVVTIDADNITSDILEQITKIPITVVGVYAGVSYEYTKELTILRSADMIVYDVVPSVDSVVVDKDGNMNTKTVSCKVYATSSDDRRYALSALPSGYQLKYGYGDTADTALALGGSATASADHTRITFALYDNKGALLDLETVPIVSFGKDGKGIEYIFKRTTNSTPPGNPTPSDWRTNAEYLRTDKEYVPSGWTDDPTGVDAVNLYEWVSKRVSVNGHWGAFSDPAEYAHFGKHAAKATLSDYIVTIPTDSAGNSLAAFSEAISCTLVVDGKLCSSLSVSADSLPSGVSISGTTINVSYAKGYALGKSSKVVKVKVSGKLDNASYSDTITLTILPNVSGVDGDGYEYVFYLSNSSTPPSKPSRANGNLSSGWVDDPPSPTDTNRYVYVSYYEGKVGAPNVSQGLWSAPALWAYKAPKGDTGKQGVGNVTSITKNDWNERTWNNAGTYGTVWTFGSDTSSKRNGCRVDDLFTVTGTATDTKNAHTITYKSLTDSGALKGSCLSHSVAYRGDPGGSGPRGTKGPIQRIHDGFVTGSYDYSDGTKDTDKFIDIVVVNGQVYYCSLSYTSSSPSVTDGHWTQGSNFDLVATKLLLAENATITMANSQQINIIDGNTLWGSFRYAATNDDYALWLGASNGASAPFSVKRSGFTKMTEADITGKITATSGKIGAFEINTITGGYYQLYANYPGVAGFSAPSSISLNSQGILAQSGVPGNGARFFFGNTEFTDSIPSWNNGALQISVQAPNGANSSQTAANISAMGKSGYTVRALELSAQGGSLNYALRINKGCVSGARPEVIKITSSTNIRESSFPSGCTIICNNTSSDITVTLPSGIEVGTTYRFIKQGKTVTFQSASSNLAVVNNIGLMSSVSSITAREWINCLWDGSVWNIEMSRS